ncbi:hypothetical protein F442_07555, partial [Phytophthora nicotianae P10297]
HKPVQYRYFYLFYRPNSSTSLTRHWSSGLSTDATTRPSFITGAESDVNARVIDYFKCFKTIVADNGLAECFGGEHGTREKCKLFKRDLKINLTESDVNARVIDYFKCCKTIVADNGLAECFGGEHG